MEFLLWPNFDEILMIVMRTGQCSGPILYSFDINLGSLDRKNKSVPDTSLLPPIMLHESRGIELMIDNWSAVDNLVESRKSAEWN